MTIHPSTIAKAEKAGVNLYDAGSKELDKHWNRLAMMPRIADMILAHNPKHNLVAFGATAPAALEQVSALMRIKGVDDSRVIVYDHDDPFMVAVFNHNRSKTAYRGFFIPTDALSAILELDQANKQWLGTKVPSDGGEAYRQGFTAGDNPFTDEDGDSNLPAAWDEEWDAAADEEQNAEEDTGGSVVRNVYRQRYREAGHPNHCGDWLAGVLNNIIIIDGITNTQMFKSICEANGLNMDKYKQEGKGWEGRFRMTGRNLLARIVFTSGVLVMPKTLVKHAGAKEFRAPQDWLDAQSFKAKKAQADLAKGREAKK